MRTEVRLCIDVADVPGGGRALLERVGCGPDVAKIDDAPVRGVLDAWVTLDDKDPRLVLLLDLLRREGTTWLEWRRDVYTEEELNAAPLLLVEPMNDCTIRGGVTWGTTYDLASACPACGTGGRQTSAVFVAGEQQGDLAGRRFAATMFMHLLVDEGLGDELVRIGATGLSLGSVYARMPDQRQVKLRRRQMCAAKTLPPMSPRTTGLVRERPCEVCQRNGYSTTIGEPPRIVYRAENLRDADDVNLSWENHGFAVLRPSLEESLLSNPWMLVTPRVRRVFREAGAEGIEWIPVRVEAADEQAR